MRFVKAIWKLLVGVKDALVLIFMLLFFGLLYAGLKSEPRSIGEGVLALRLDGALVEQAERPGASVLAGGSVARETELRDLLATLDAAADDSRVKAVALDLDRFTGGGQVALADLGRAIDAFRRASSKPVVAFATGYSSDSYQLASHASEVWLSPLGAVAVAGPGGSNLYYKGLFDKLGVTAHVFKVGTYKAAVEPYMRADMSPEARENATALAGALFEDWKDEVAKARPAAAAGIASTLADPVGMANAAGGDLSKAALDTRLVDRLGERREYEARLAELGGKDVRATGGYKQVRFADYRGYAHGQAPSGPIGIVHVAGMIVDGKAGNGTAGGETIAGLIDEAVAGGKLKALVVRVDSPGGSVTASERIRQSILGAKAAGLPVVVSMGSVAASGGYWITTPADAVFAEPETITGSIGVFGVIPTFEGTLGKLGVTTDGIATTPLAGQPDILGGLNPEAEQLLQAGVASTYGRFLGLVAKARHKTPAEVDRIAQGRVWDGGTARQIGLVDGFGSLDSAIAKAAELAQLGDERGVTWIDRAPSFEEQVVAWLADDETDTAGPSDAFALLAPAPAAMLERALAQASAVLAGPSLQAVCLECPPPAAAPQLGQREKSLLAFLGWGRGR